MAWYEDTSQTSCVWEYSTYEDVQADAEDAAEYGWRLVSVTELSQRSGCTRMLVLGVFAFLFKPRPHFLATFNRGAALHGGGRDGNARGSRRRGRGRR